MSAPNPENPLWRMFEERRVKSDEKPFSRLEHEIITSCREIKNFMKENPGISPDGRVEISQDHVLFGLPIPTSSFRACIRSDFYFLGENTVAVLYFQPDTLSDQPLSSTYTLVPAESKSIETYAPTNVVHQDRLEALRIVSGIVSSHLRSTTIIASDDTV